MMRIMCSISARVFGEKSAPPVNQYPILANPIRMNDESFSNEFKITKNDFQMKLSHDTIYACQFILRRQPITDHFLIL